MNKTNKIDPTRKMNLRQAGDSVMQMQIDKLLKLIIAWMVFVMLFVLTYFEFLFEYTNVNHHPYLALSLFALYSIFIIYYKRKIYRDLDNLALGKRGERYVSNQLNSLVREGTHVINDLPGRWKNNREFNIDHIIISTRGIFAIETKTWSKGLEKDSSLLEYKDGDLIKVSKNYNVGSHEIQESKNHATVLQQIIKERLALDLEVKPVLVFPKWFVNRDFMDIALNETGVYISNSDYFINGFNNREDGVISNEKVEQIYNSLNSYVVKYLEDEFNK